MAGARGYCPYLLWQALGPVRRANCRTREEEMRLFYSLLGPGPVGPDSLACGRPCVLYGEGAAQRLKELAG
jgi:hypothetical protein